MAFCGGTKLKKQLNIEKASPELKVVHRFSTKMKHLKQWKTILCAKSRHYSPFFVEILWIAASTYKSKHWFGRVPLGNGTGFSVPICPNKNWCRMSTATPHANGSSIQNSSLNVISTESSSGEISANMFENSLRLWRIEVTVLIKYLLRWSWGAISF